jgi:hypothetical protein
VVGIICPPPVALVGIGLTELPSSWGVEAPPPLATHLVLVGILSEGKFFFYSIIFSRDVSLIFIQNDSNENVLCLSLKTQMNGFIKNDSKRSVVYYYNLRTDTVKSRAVGHFWGATNQDVLLLLCPEINQMMSA